MQDLRRLTLAIFGVLLLLQSVRAEIVSIVTWNLEWFPGGKTNSSQAERLVRYERREVCAYRYSP